MSQYLHGIHEPCPQDVMPRGWILFLAEVGHGYDPHPGIDFTPWSVQGYGIICRIQHAWGTGGTLPLERDLPGYLQRVQTLVENSQGCNRWIIGNEPNHPQEWPDGQSLSPEYVADVYNQCRVVIDGEVLLAPVAPWNDQCGYGWVEYFTRMIDACDTVEAFALHTYSRGPDPSSITDTSKMDPPYQEFYSGFQSYRDWMAAIPQRYRDRPVYITETDQNGPWLDAPNTWCQDAYAEIDSWNQRSNTQKIRALILYRWPMHDQYHIVGKPHVIADFKAAQAMGYKWTGEPTEPPEEEPMPEWIMLHRNACETGFYDWVDENGHPVYELTFPNGTRVHYIQGHPEGNYDRVEVDEKDANRGHPEVYEGRYAVSLNWRSSTGRAGVVSDPIYVLPGKPVRGTCQYQHVFDGGHGGARYGIVMGGPDDPFAGDRIAWTMDEDPFNYAGIAWGGWASSRDSDGLPNRTWATLRTPEAVPPGSYVRFVAQVNADDAGNSMAGIFDVMTIEQYSDGAPPVPEPPDPPTPTECNALTAAEIRTIVRETIREEIAKIRLRAT